MTRWTFLFLLLGLPGLATAQTCPAAPDHLEEETVLLEQIQAAQDEGSARVFSNALWELWLDAPDARAQDLLDRAMARRQSFDFSGARGLLDDLVSYCPDYAEGWNQRAFVAFLVQDFDGALADLDRTLAINPRHVGALSGKALTLIGLGREEEAQVTLRDALALNPWLAERALLQEVPGEDI